MSDQTLKQRRSGLLVPLTALPGPPDHGDMDSAAQLIEWLVKTGSSVWQVLPLGLTHLDRSPYLCLSAHAGDPALIGREWLRRQGLLDRTDPTHSRRQCLREAYDKFQSQPPPGWRDKFETFIEQQRYWLGDFALFIAIREAHDNTGWTDWPVPLRDRQPAALNDTARELDDRIRHIQFNQFLFFEQWANLKTQANDKGVYLFGDMPLFVAHDSADVWSRRTFFKLRPDGEPDVVAGVPPDYFSATGQRWGNPHYHWENLAADDFSWWLERMQTQLTLYDLVRLDHFRGLAAAWEIPADNPTGEHGAWCPTPGRELLQALREKFGQLPLVAEDLGVITDDVNQLRDDFELPAMAVLQFAFDGGDDNPYLPHNIKENSVVYTGTHDNDTTLSWFQNLPQEKRQRTMSFLRGTPDDMPWPLIECALESRARLAVILLQDALNLGQGHRINTPGTTEGNWGWRFRWEWLTDEVAERLRALNERFERTR